jgi:hypothetical protein
MRFVLLVLLAASAVASAEEPPTLEALARRHAVERAAIARIHSRAVAAPALAALLGKQAAELRGYAETASEGSATIARARAEKAELQALEVKLDLDPSLESRLAAGNERELAILVQHAAGESQEKLVSVLEARIESPLCPASVKDKIGGACPGALVLEGADARSLGVTWGRVELLLDKGGKLRGVDLVSDERENLIQELMKRGAE